MKGTMLLVCLWLCSAFALDPNWHLVWSDEFEGDTLDTTKWTARQQEGNPYNGEKQYYLPQMVSVSDGKLILKSDNTANVGGYPYISGWVDTQTKFFSTYGRYEVYAQLPRGKGMWPAHWLLSEEFCWPLGAEIDIMENLGNNMSVVYGTYHYGNCCGCNLGLGLSTTASVDLSQGFHIYAVEWTPQNITWYLDDTVYHVVTNANLNNYTIDPSPHYWILNTAVGGDWGGPPDNTTVFPQYHYIEHVRVYVWGNPCSNGCSNHGCCNVTTTTCACDAGWSGTDCEYSTGTFVDKFVAFDSQVDEFQSGWGNGYSFYSQKNAAINNGLVLTINNESCPASCSGLKYAAGAWISKSTYSHGTFSWTAKLSNAPGTGAQLLAEGYNPYNQMDQISFLLSGVNPYVVSLLTTQAGLQFTQAVIKLPFDISQGYHVYSFTYTSTYIEYYVDGQLQHNATVGIPTASFEIGAVFSAQPVWFGGSFTYTAPLNISVSQVSWTIIQDEAVC